MAENENGKKERTITMDKETLLEEGISINTGEKIILVVNENPDDVSQ